MNIKTNNHGIAIVIALIIVLVLIPIGLGLIYLMNPEMKFTIMQNQSTRATFIAEAGANQAMSEVLVQFARDFPINVATVSTTTLQIHADTTTYSASTYTAVQFFSSYTAFNFVPATGEAILISSGTTDDGGVYYATASITAHPDPMGDGSVQNPIWNNVSAAAQFYYKYRIESTGKIRDQIARIALDSHDISDKRKMVRKSGSFEVGLTQSLARFALCVGQMQTKNGEDVYFIGKSPGGVYTGAEFYGPVHSNGMLNISQEPRFYNNLTTAQDLINFDSGGPQAADSWGVDVPFIQAPYSLSRGVNPIALPNDPADSATLKNIALAGYATAGNGIYLPNDGIPTGGFSGTTTGGILVEGDVVELKFKPHTYGGDDFCVYEIIQDTITNTGKVIAINVSQNETWIQNYAGWAWGAGWTKYQEQPNGVLFVDKEGTEHGKINSISGTVQKDTPMTIAAMGEIIITDHLLYEGFTFDKNDPGKKDLNKEVLGLISWEDDITIDVLAPDDLSIYGTFLTPDGQLWFEDWEYGTKRVTVTLYGGMIADFYGPVGNYSAGILVNGYARRFAWDPRFSGMAPPHYPVINDYLVTIDQNFNVYPSYQRLKK